MRRLKAVLLDLIAAVLYYTGISPLIKTIRCAVFPSVRILLYHSVQKRESFEHQMEYLKRRFKVVSLDDVTRGGLERNCIAVTFDDGFKDNHSIAYPILKRLGIPATVFVASSYVGERSMLSWDEIREMSENGITIGAHTVNHRILSTLSGDEAKQELAGSKREIESRIGRPVHHFAYPKGKIEDFNQETIVLAKECGFRTASSTRRGLNTGRGDRFQLKRTPIEPDETEGSFRRTLNGYWDFLSLRDCLH
jgi:peptidoglycan/xylan/chitin deacetylase (PgdA/CDA1 family)